MPPIFGAAAIAGGSMAGAGTAAIAGGASIIGAGISAAAGGGGGQQQQSQYYLPPELEVQYLDFFQNQLSQIDQFMQQNDALMQEYNKRADLADRAMQGAIPDADAMKSLSATSTQIAMLAGGDAETLMKNGFLTQLDQDLLQEQQQELDALQALEAQDFVDPRIENQLTDQRRQLEQDLARQGVGPAQRAIALSQFERQASELRFSTTQQLRSEGTQRGLARMGAITGISSQAGAAQQLGLQRAAYGFQALQQQLQAGQSAAQNFASFGAQRYGVGQQGLSVANQLLNTQQGAYQSAGQFGFTKPTQQLLSAGTIGPGSLYQQTGVPTQGVGANLRNAQRQENETYKQRTGINTGPLPQLNFNRFSGQGISAEEAQRQIDQFYFR